MWQLRPARETDVAAIHGLIVELAEFERLHEQVCGTPADLARHLFGEPRYAHALLAECDGAAAGFALYFFSYSTFLCRPGLYLEDLYVRAACRGRGIGQALLRAVEQCALARGCGRLEWAVLDWNQRAIGLYERFGAHARGGWTVYRKELPVASALADAQACRE